MADVPPAKAQTVSPATNPSGVSGAALPTVQQGVPLTKEAVLVSLYDDAARRINENAAKAIRDLSTPEARAAIARGERVAGQFRLARAATLRSQIDAELRRLNVRAGAIVANFARESYALGLREAIAQMREIGVADAVSAAGGRGALAFSVVDTRAVDVIARDMVAQMTQAAAQHGAQAARLFRAVSADVRVAEPAFNRAIARGLVTGDPIAADRAVRDVFRDPADPTRQTVRQVGAQKIQVGQWSGTVRQYAQIVSRTRTREATVIARHERLQSNGLDLVQITGAVSANFCTRFIGLVVTLGEARDGYPSIRELPGGGPPFHPNCSKGTAMFHPQLSSASRATAHERALPAFRRAQANDQLTDNLT